MTLCHASLLVSLTALPSSLAAAFTLAQSARLGADASAMVVAITRNRIFMLYSTLCDELMVTVADLARAG
ncbi:hypothetical protein KBAHV22_13820 [Aeromonas hydrophila]|nr:hypothetical protein KBAHV42_13740 [Aeromonas hydrophila]CAD7522525.1 hypothetical protein KBAHV22_13820 [Aeromonas hydrophila]CAD7523382.1 hypothetical protein KBAHV01_14460 [Aeromonas hydrophila]